MTFPDFELVLLRRVHRPAHDLKNVRGGAAVAVLHADGPHDYHGGTRSRAACVGTGATSPPSARHRVPISTGSNRPEGATRADGVHKIALREHHGFAGR